MSLNIVAVQPGDGSTGVILQGAVIVTFDQEIDVTTFSEASFLLSAPPESGILMPDATVTTVTPTSGTDYVQGVFSFALNNLGATVATFSPSRPLRPNVKYTVLIANTVEGLDGTPLAAPYSFSFTTGILNLRTPPPQNPLPSQVGRIRPCDLVVTPASTLNNDLHQVVITLPENIDPTSFDPDSVEIELEAFLQDVDVVVPTLISKTVVVTGKTITISLAF